jgi:serpin B
LFSEKKAAVPSEWPSNAPTQREGSRSFAGDNNDFAFALYELLRQQPGNLFFSPFSIRTALAMTYAGAMGETAAQMRKALRFSSSTQLIHEVIGQVIRRLNASTSGGQEVALANSLWSQQGASLKADFVELIARHYGGNINLVDFCDNAEAARRIINQWVEDRTRQRIRDLIPSGALSIDTRLVLVNAVYFNGMWVLQFENAATQLERFHLESGGTVRAALMYRHEQIRYLRTAGYQAVDLLSGRQPIYHRAASGQEKGTWRARENDLWPHAPRVRDPNAGT